MRLLALFLVVCLVQGSAAAEETPDKATLTTESRAKAKAFAGALRGALQSAIKTGGPEHAVTVCNAEAPDIARRLSADGWTVARTSQKLRNPDNAPDTWEAEVLNAFAARAEAGESLKAMEASIFLESGGATTFRYMKAIPVGQVCLTCHGKALDPELQRVIGVFYPEDQATGFAEGELRGAFTISKTLD